MAQAINLSFLEAFQNYIRDYSGDIIRELLVEYKTGMLCTNHEGVQGQLVLTQAIIGDIVKRWASAFQPTTNAITLKPRVLTVNQLKVDLTFVPSEMKTNYVGRLRQNGEDPMDFPMAALFYQMIREKVREQLEYNAWRAVATGSPASGDAMSIVFDGFHEIIKDEITATNLTAIVTGALTSSNTVAAVETCVKGLGDAYLNQNVDVFLNPVDAINYVTNYRGTFGNFYGKNPGSNETFSLDFGNVTVHSLSGVKKDSITVTPKANLHVGYNFAVDADIIRVTEHIREIYAIMDFSYGVQIGLVNNNIMRVNNMH